MQRLWIFLAALAGFVAVAMAAVTAHGLDPEHARIAHSAVEMNAWHALALFGVGLWRSRAGRWADAVGAVFVLGMLVFCGSVYALGFGVIGHAPLAPVGGTILMLGWLLLAASALRARLAHAP